jgi:hypothetical protein
MTNVINLSLLAKENELLWIFAFFSTVFIILTPVLLFEFRYFIISFLFIILHIEQCSIIGNYIQLLHYLIINSIVIYLFLCKQFEWPNGQKAHFMW